MKHKNPADGPETGRRLPCFKIQLWNDEGGAWQDLREDFETLDDLADYAIMKLPWTATNRVVTVDRRGGRHEHKLWDAFGEPR